MIRIQLVHEGRVVKTISSRVHESVVLAQLERYKEPYDEVHIVEGVLSEGAKDILHHVAKKVVPAAMAAGIALAGANGAHAQNVGVPGQNRDFPGLDRSIGQHVADIFSPNYNERMRQRQFQQQTAQQEWNAEQNELRQARIQAARERGRAEAGLPPTGSQNVRVYDQARTSNDGKYFIIYGMDNSITRIPTAGTEFMAGDSQRLPHYISPSGQVFYVRHPAGTMHESVEEGFAPISTIPASGTGKNVPTRTGGPAVNDDEEPAGLGGNTPNTPNATATVAQANQIAKPGQQQTGNTTNLNIDQNGQISLGDEEEPAGIREDAELDSILSQYSDAYKAFKEGGDIDDNPDFFQALFDYYSNNGEMPYGVQKAREGDPYQWIADRLDRESGSMDPVAEAAEFGAYYSEQLAQKVFDQNPNLSCTGKCEELLDAAWPIAVTDLGQKRAQYEFSYNEDFPSDFVSAYSHLQKQGVAEGLSFNDKRGKWEWDDGTRVSPDELTPAQKQRIQKWKAANPGKRPSRASVPDTREPARGFGGRVFEEGVAEAEYDLEASPADQASVDQNIIVQLKKACDNEVPQPLQLNDGEITISADTAKKILAKFDTLKPASKELMQQTLSTGEGFRELLNYFGEREIHEEVDDISNEMMPAMEAYERAQRLIKSVFGNR